MSIELVAFDLDGTLVRSETCVQAIARAVGRADECAVFEQLSMRDVEGVAAARELMAEWYAPYSVVELTRPLDDLELAPGCAEAFELLREHDVWTAIVSITWTLAVEHFADLLGADYFYGTGLSERGVEHVWPQDKGNWLRALSLELRLTQSAVAAVGDSDGDRELLGAAGLRFCVGEQALDVAGLVHLPGASMLDIARLILGERND